MKNLKFQCLHRSNNPQTVGFFSRGFMISLFFFFTSLSVSAQEPQRGSMRGTVFSAKDSIELQGVKFELAEFTLKYPSISYKSGIFFLLDVPYGKYQMKVSSQGYEATEIPVVIDKRIVEIGNIYLQPRINKYAVVRGNVLSAQDSTSLYGAYVIFTENNTGKPSGYHGFFSLPNVQYGKQELTFSYIGFETRKIQFTVDKDTVNLGNIFLTPDAKTLKEVVVKGEIPMMQQKGDTIQYNAAAFKTRPEATALDLVNKMPGVTADGAGVKVQGKKVEKIYLNGSEFFSDDPKKALSYLPANSVQTIKVYEEQGSENSDAGSNNENLISAMNIQTIGHEKKMLLGNIKGAGGTNLAGDNMGLYQLNGSVIYKIPKHTFGAGATVNNMNNGAITDMLMPMEGISGRRGGNQPGLVKAWETSYDYDDKKLKIHGNYSGSLSSSDRFLETRSSYYPQLPIFDSKEQFNKSNSTTTTNNQKGNVNIRWSPNKKNNFIFNPSFSMSNNKTFSSTFANTIQDNDTVSRSKNVSENKNINYSLGSSLAWYHYFDKKGRFISISSNYSLLSNSTARTPLSIVNENYNATTGKWTLVDLSSNRLMDGNIKNNRLYSRLNFENPLPSKNPDITKSINCEMTFRREWGHSSNYAYRFNKIDSLYNRLDTATTNIYDKDYNNITGRISYFYTRNKQKKSFYNYKIGLSISHFDRYRYNFMPLTTKMGDISNTVQPSLSINYKSKYSFNYNGSALLPDIESLTPYIDDVNPLSLTVGNPDLKKGYSHRITIGYNSSGINTVTIGNNLFNKGVRNTSYGLNLTARAETNPISANRISLPINRDTVIYISDNPNDTIGKGYHPQRGAMLNKYVNLGSRYNIGANANLDFSVPLTKNVVKLMAMYNYSNASSLYQSKLNKQNGHTFNLNTSITSYAWENVDYTITSNSNFGYTNNTVLSDNKYFNESLFTTLNVVLPQDFVVGVDFNWLYSKSFLPESPKSTVGLLNFNAGKLFLKNRNLKVTLNGYDLLNQSKNRMQIITNDYITNTRTNTFGRYVMLKLSYNFNSLKRATQDELRQKYFEENRMNNLQLQPINNSVNRSF